MTPEELEAKYDPKADALLGRIARSRFSWIIVAVVSVLAMVGAFTLVRWVF